MTNIEDLLILNNTSFGDAIKDIYPTVLRFKKTTKNATDLSYLVTIENWTYFTTLYNKRDNLQTDIVNFPDMSSTIPSKPAYGV